MMNMRYLLFLFIISWLMFSGQALATNDGLIALTPQEQDWIAEHPQITLAPDPNYHPIEFFDNQSHYRGIAADYMALLEKRLGLHFKVLRPRDWNQVLDWAQSRKTDMMTSAVQTPQRSEYMLFTSPYLEYPAVIISKKNVTGQLNLANLHGMKVGITSGDAVQEYIIRNHLDINLDVVPNIPTGLKKLSFGMIDAFVGDLTTISYHIEQEGITNLRIAGQTEFNYRLTFSSRSDWPLLHSILQKGLDSISPNEREAIYRKWVNLQPESLFASKRFWQLIFGLSMVASVIITSFITWNRALKKQVAQKTKELQASEEKYRTILENAVEGMFQTSPEGKFIACNFAMAHLLGYDSPDQLMSEPDLARHLYVDPKQRDILWQRVAMDGLAADFEVELCRKDGKRLWVTSNVRAVHDQHGKLLFLEGFVSDITARKKAELAFHESERRLSTLMDNLPGMAYRSRADRQRTMEFVSGGCHALTGYSSADLIGKHQRPYREHIIPEDRQRVWQQIEDTLESKQPYLIEYRIRTADDEERWVWEQGRAITSSDNDMVTLEGFIIDITKRKKAEETLRESDRMKSEFVTTAAHEFRTPLTSIQGFSQLLLTQHDLSVEDRNECLHYISERAEALAKIVADLLDISRIEARQKLLLNRSHCSVTEIMKQLQPLLKTIAKTHRLEVALTEEQICLNVDMDKIGQVLENLLSNALKYSPAGSLIQIRNDQVEDGCSFTVIDQGIGMTTDQLSKMFDKFYRADASHMAVEGLGLGMSIVKHIIEAHGGKIWVNSERHCGTTVCFTLPRVDCCDQEQDVKEATGEENIDR